MDAKPSLVLLMSLFLSLLWILLLFLTLSPVGRYDQDSTVGEEKPVFQEAAFAKILKSFENE